MRFLSLKMRTNKLQEKCILVKDDNNNTSSEFCLPSELKDLWKEFVSEDIVDILGEYIEDHQEFINVVQTVVDVLIEVCQNQIDHKFGSVYQLLCVNKNEKAKQKVQSRLRPIMQEFIDTIFNHDENLVEIKKEFLALLNRTINSKFSEAVRLDFTNIDKHISKFSKILISLLLHEPKVTLSLPYSLRKSNSKNDKIENVKFDQKQHYCIDGFANQEKQCVVVLPSPMMNGYPFMGIKTTVLIVEDRGVKKETKPPKSTIDKNIVEVGKTGGFADQPIKDMIIDVNKISTHQSLRNHTSINSYRRLSELASFDRTPVRNVRNNLEYRSKDDSDRKFQWKTYVEKFPENDFQNDF